MSTVWNTAPFGSQQGLLERIVALGPEDLEWDFDQRNPQYAMVADQYRRKIPVDAFPGYAHDSQLVRETALAVENTFPIGFRPRYYLLSHEVTSRTNGYADRDWIYNEGNATWSSWEPRIVLSGKRIPLHPAMTRYLVAHEYGHVAQWWIEHCRQIDNRSVSVTEMDKRYMELRPGAETGYGGGRWHTNVGELIANDFRILVAGIEPEFWPHPGFPHPFDVPELMDFWNKAVEECSAA